MKKARPFSSLVILMRVKRYRPARSDQLKVIPLERFRIGHKPFYVTEGWLLISNKLCDSTLCTCGGVGRRGWNRCIMLIMTLETNT